MIFCVQLFAQQKVQFSFTKREYRDSITISLKKQVKETISLPLSEENYKKWAGAFWAMELMLYQPAGYERTVLLQLKMIEKTSPDFQRSFLEMLYTLYPKQFGIDLKAIWKKLSGDKVKAMALEYMALAGIFPVIDQTESFYLSGYYSFYKKRWQQQKEQLPSKKDFLQADFLPGQNVLCSFQATNRDKPGYLQFRTGAGKWLTDDKGRILKFPQLARSITNLPYYLTNGNTPQGLFRITGIDTSDNNWIGPTTNLQMIMPFENGPAIFFGADTSFTIFYYKLLGPLSKFTSLWQSYEAGKTGRSEIIAHGTTIDPQFYIKQKYFPCTPSLGCLCSPETWNDNGERMYSAQSDWIKLLLALKSQPVYIIVSEVKDL